MKFKKFIIQHYRAITDPIHIDLERSSLVPIIGVNECGKTTILHALLAFDCFNDDLHSGRHLEDVVNLYSADNSPAVVTAEVSISKKDFRKRLAAVAEQDEWKDDSELQRYLAGKPRLPTHLRISRDLHSREYTISEDRFAEPLQDAIAREVLSHLPYILYFDDFQEKVDDKIAIVEEERASDWLKTVATLFQKTDEKYSVYDLPKKEDRQRKTILSKVRKKLDKTLTQEWQKFRLDDLDRLRVSLDYVEESVGGQTQSFIKFEIVETDDNGEEHFFYIGNRSKGFYWFFNFVMKLEFNPKVVGDADVDAIYLLDEPGSYLHAVAQARLCRKLQVLAHDSMVLYCTHSHHLLDPTVIPLSSIRIAEKDGNGNVKLIPIHEHRGSMTERRTAYQPILDALETRSIGLELGAGTIVVVEGIVDYYLLDVFRDQRNVVVIPSVGADSIAYFVSLLIAWRHEYRALWDNDEQGRKACNKARKHFGADEAKQCFRLLPAQNQSGKTIIQDFVAGGDVAMLRRELGIARNAGFDKTIAAWYFSERRDELRQDLSSDTVDKFGAIWAALGIEKAGSAGTAKLADSELPAN